MFNLKSSLMLVASIAIFVLMWRQIVISLTEKAPTPVAVESWSRERYVAQWLSVTGVLRPDLGATNNSGTAFIPLVAGNARDSDPIHFVVVESDARLAGRAGRATVTGVLAPSNWDLSRLLPGRTFAPDVVCLNAGTTPNGAGSTLFMIFLALGLGGLAAWRLTRAWHAASEGLKARSI